LHHNRLVFNFYAVIFFFGVTHNGVRVGVVHEVNYINPVLSVCTEGQTDGTNPNSVICKPEGIADNEGYYEKLPGAGDFLLGYMAVVAGYNPLIACYIGNFL